jgi:hypothetical protein
LRHHGRYGGIGGAGGGFGRSGHCAKGDSGCRAEIKVSIAGRNDRLRVHMDKKARLRLSSCAKYR